MSLFHRIFLALALLISATVGGHSLCALVLLYILNNWTNALPARLKHGLQVYSLFIFYMTLFVNIVYFAFHDSFPVFFSLLTPLANSVGLYLWATRSVWASVASLLCCVLLFIVSQVCPRAWKPVIVSRRVGIWTWIFAVLSLVVALVIPTGVGCVLLCVSLVVQMRVAVGISVPFPLVCKILSLLLGVFCICQNEYVVEILPTEMAAVLNLFLWCNVSVWTCCLKMLQLLGLVGLLLICSSCLHPTSTSSTATATSNSTLAEEHAGLLATPSARSSATRRRTASREFRSGEGSVRHQYDTALQVLCVLCSSVYFIYFPTLVSLSLLPMCFFGLKVHFEVFTNFLMPTAAALGIGLLGQYGCLLPHVVRLPSPSKRVLLFLQNTESYTLCLTQVLLSASLFVVFISIRNVCGVGAFSSMGRSPVISSVRRSRTRRSGSGSDGTPETTASSTPVDERVEETTAEVISRPEAIAILTEERVTEIEAFGRLALSAQSTESLVALFKQCVGRPPRSAEEAWLVNFYRSHHGDLLNHATEGGEVQGSGGDVHTLEELVSKRAIIASSLWRRLLLSFTSLLYLTYYPTILLCLLLCGTWISSFDVLHGLLLLLLVFYYVEPELAVRHPEFAPLSICVVGTVLILFNYGSQFCTTVPENLPGTEIPLTLLGFKCLSKPWEVWPYWAATGLLFVLQRSVVGRCIGWSALLSRRDLRAFQYSPSLQVWLPRIMTVLALVTAMSMAFVSYRSFFICGLLLGTLSLLIAVSYHLPKATWLCRRLCGVYGVLVALTITACQAPLVQHRMLHFIGLLPRCSAEEPVTLRDMTVFDVRDGGASNVWHCAKEIGIIVESSSDWLLLQVAPWYITVGLVLSARSSSTHIAADSVWYKDAPLQRLFSFVSRCGSHYGGGIMVFLTHLSVFLSWVALLSSARGYPSVIHAVYLGFLFLDFHPSLVWPYAIAHCVISLFYPLRWIPAIDVQVPLGYIPGFASKATGVMELSDLLGLKKYNEKGEEHISALHVVWYPLLVLMSMLLRHATSSRQSERLLSYMSTSLLFIGYECVLFALIIALYVGQYSVLGPATLAMFLLIFIRGRVQLLESTKYLVLLTAGVSALLGYVFWLQFYFAHINTFGDITSEERWTPGNEGREWLRWLFDEKCCVPSFYWSYFVVLCLLHSVRRHSNSILAASGAYSIHSYNGCTSLLDWVKNEMKHSRDNLQSLNYERFSEVIPTIPTELCSNWYYRLNMWLTRCMCFFAFPLAVVTLSAGALLRVSLVNSLFVVAGMLLVAYAEVLHWYFYILWRPLAALYLLAPIGALVCHCPTVHDFFAYHQKWASTLVGYSTDADEFFCLERMHIVVFFFVVLQTKTYTSFCFEKILHELYSASDKRQQRFEERQARLLSESRAAVESARQYEIDLNNQIKELREKVDSIRSPVFDLSVGYGHRLGADSSVARIEDEGPVQETLFAPEERETLEVKSSPGAVSASRGEKRGQPRGAEKRKERTPTEGEVADRSGFVNFLGHAALLFAHYTYDREDLESYIHATLQPSSTDRTRREGRCSLCDALRCFCYVLWKSIEHHTSLVVLAGALLNCMITGCLYEVIALIFILLVPLVYHPFAPQASYQLLLLYITIGILLKTVVQIVTVEHPPTKQVADILSRLLVRISLTTRVDDDVRITQFAFGMDYVTFILVIMHQFVSIHNGVYDNVALRHRTLMSVGDREVSLPSAAHPVTTAAAPALSDTEETREEREGDGDQEQIIPMDTSIITAAAEVKDYLSLTFYERARRAIVGYWRNMMKVNGVGAEHYVWYTLFHMVSLFVVIAGYSSIINSDSVTIQENVRNNLLPAKLVLLVCLSAVQLIVERLLYIKRWMTVKIIFNMLTCTAYCTVYWHWRANGSSHLTGDIYFTLKVTEIYFSVLQIRDGFPRHRRPDPFTTKPGNVLLVYCYSVYKAIPFLWECRTMLDWTLVHTSLELNEYLKVEDIYDTVYQRQVELAREQARSPPRTLGSAVPSRVKWSAGVSRVALILVTLLAPLWYYSSLNPSVSENEVKQTSLSLSFMGSHPFFTATITETVEVPPMWPQWISRTRPVLSSYGFLQEEKRVQLAQLSSCSDELWQISPESLKKTRKNLEDVVNGAGEFFIVQDLVVERTKAPSSSSLMLSTTNKWKVTVDMAEKLLMTFNSTYNESVLALDFYSPFVFNKPSEIMFYPSSPAPPKMNYMNCSLRLRREKDSLNQQNVLYWCLECETLFTAGNVPAPNASYEEWTCLEQGIGCKYFNYEKEDSPITRSNTTSPVYFVFLSDNIVVGLSFLNKFGLVALYTTFVLTIGRLLRNMMAGKASAMIQSDMVNPVPISHLMQSIRAAREAGDLTVEHSVYLDLVDLLRSPEKLLTVTGEKKHQYKE